jgi:hypothetical protein
MPFAVLLARCLAMLVFTRGALEPAARYTLLLIPLVLLHVFGSLRVHVLQTAVVEFSKLQFPAWLIAGQCS